ncbi:lamin tail domain-containing protein [Actinocorallia longicatena]|uniref:LTD domain-containing protein n=1 Tax=Actinocorallia longicatena TaxID=111803 RepID=A0ABP6QFN5_9ACTN
MRLVLAGAAAAALALAAVPGAAQAAAPTVKIVKVLYDPSGKDTRENAQLVREYVVIKNTGRKAVKLKGWTLKDVENHVYRFKNIKLKAKASLTVHTGKGRDGAKHVYMNRGWYIWNNIADTATLRNAAGRKVSTRSWNRKPTPPPPPAGNDPRFSTCTEAKASGYGPYYQGSDPEYYWYQDRDKDGVVCE